MRLSLARVAMPIVLLPLLLAACGGGQDLPTETARALQGRVEAVVVAASAGDADAARAGLAALRGDVDAAQRLGRLSDERAAEVLAAAAEVEASLPVLEPAPEPEVEPAPEPATEPEPERGPSQDDEGEDKGKGESGKQDD